MTRDEFNMMFNTMLEKNGGIIFAGEAAWLMAHVIAAVEREACAKVCEETTAAWTQPVYNGACVDCAVAIRARRWGR